MTRTRQSTEPVPRTATDPAAAEAATRLHAERYRAIAARDRRFDGQFFTAVRTTGIYCRPSCPAPTPRPENVTFFHTSAAAHEAGYRACRRCLPEAVPGSPEWDSRSDVAARAMRLIRDGLVDRAGVAGLADRLGYSPRHLHRVLAGELGAGPIALARATRARTARDLLTQTDLPMAQVAYAAGFGSIRQFNDTIGEVFATTPTELRERSRRGTGGQPAAAGRPGPASGRPGPATAGRPGPAAPTRPGTLVLRLPLREPFDAVGIFAYLAARAIDGVESADVSNPERLRYTRTLALPTGPGAFEATFCANVPDDVRRAPAGGPRRRAGGAPGLDVRLELTSLADLPAAVARVRALFDLDADPLAVDDVLARDPALAPSVQAVPGIRLPGAVDPAELLIRALIGQQISVPAARTHLIRLAGLGAPYRGSFGVDRLFPTTAAIAADDTGRLTGPARRIAAIRGTAAALADGSLDVSPGADAAALRAALLERPGIGTWTAGYLAMRVLHDPDVLLVSDGALIAGARALGLLAPGPGVPRSAERAGLVSRAEAWAPWRSYAGMHMWRAAGAGPPRGPIDPRENQP